MKTKRCYRCSTEKPIDQFSVERDYSRDGYGQSCSDCVRIHHPHLFRDDGTKMTYVEWCIENGIKNTKATRELKERENGKAN